jgi:uncharacterized protein YecT (DUF1311 family)
MTEPGDGQRRLNPIILALLGGVAVLLALVWYFSVDRNSDQDKLSNPQIEQSAQSDSAKLCTDSAVYSTIKSQLFSRAAQARGTDRATFDKIAGSAVLRVDNPVLESEENGVLNCSGTFYLDLPPGVTVTGGHRALTADVDYSVQPPGDAGAWVVQLRNADPIVTALTTLTQAAETDPLAPETNTIAPEGNVAAPESAAVQPGPVSSSPGRPSFDCANARSSGEAAVCADSGLAALDVNMATQYRRALASASPAQKAILQSTRDRFLAYRDRCPSRQCMADGYIGRMREIRDIMEGRFQQR